MNEVKAERYDDQIILTAPMVMKDRAKEVPGGKYDSKAKAWRYPLSWAHCVMLRGVFGTDLEVGPELAAWAASEKTTRIEPAMAAREVR